MSLELDWLEREERYRQRVTRLMTVALILVAALVGTGLYLRSRHVKNMREAAARAAEEQKLEAIRQQRQQFTADSTAAAERYRGFKEAYHAEPLEGLPLLALPLPPGQPIRAFLERAWEDYAKAVDPNVTSDESITWYRQNYTGVMNDGPLRGRAILLPKLEQKGTKLEIQKSTFSQITRAQVQVGMREEAEAPVDSALAGAMQSSSGGESTDTPASETSPTTTETAPAPETNEPAPAPEPTQSAPAPETTETAPAPEPTETPPAEPTPPATQASPTASTPAAPVPPEPAPAETLPSPTAPPDTVPHP